jgi:plastocyanin
MSQTTFSRHSRAGPLVLLATAVFAVLGCSNSKTAVTQPPNATPTTISLQNIAIHPATVTIRRGSTVRWVWLDGHLDTSHNVTSRTGGRQFKSSGTRLTGSYAVRFEKPGKYLYECTIHPASMQGEIIVQ